jgi:hypothetical protein
MRRTFALLALVATSWPHVVVLECALGSTPLLEPAESSHHAAPAHAAAHHGAGHDDSRTSAANDEGAPTHGPGCAMVMACGLVMIGSAGDTTSEPAASMQDAGRFPAVKPPSGADPVADPPPPRRHA